VRQFAHISPIGSPTSTFDRILASEISWWQLAELLRTQLTRRICAEDSAATVFSSCSSAARGARCEQWAENVAKRVNAYTFSIDDKTISATVTVGLGLLPPANPDVAAAIAMPFSARAARTRARREPDVRRDKSDTDTRVQAYDRSGQATSRAR